MKTIIVYDSFFGNTQKIADVIAEEMGAKAIRVKELKDDQLKEVELLLVGSPTRAFRPSPDITAFLDAIPRAGLEGLKVAAFDTRVEPKDIKSKPARIILGIMIKLFGYAAKPIAGKMQKRGAKLAAEPIGFCVLDSEGPLRNGEIEKARNFARQLLAGLPTH